MTVLLVSTDLLAASQVQGAATAAGAKLVTASGAKALDAAREHSPRLVAIDLSSRGFELSGLVEELKGCEPQPGVVAYAPHVHEARLRQAAEAGCDEVLTRGQFYRGAGEVIARYVAEGGDSSR